MAASFDVKFLINRTSPLHQLQLTDTSTGFTLSKAVFKITYPNGFVANNTDLSSPDISSAGGTTNKDVKFDVNNLLIRGDYLIVMTAEDDSGNTHTAQRSFNLTWKEPTLDISNTSDVTTPEVKFKDNTIGYDNGNFTETITTRTLSSGFPSTSAVAGASAISGSGTSNFNDLEINVVNSNNYYEGLYTPSLSVNITYAHTNGFLSVQYINAITESISIKRAPTQTELLTKINQYKDSINVYKSTNRETFDRLSEQYDLVIGLYSHLIDRVDATLTDGSEPILRELLEIVEPNVSHTFQSTPITQFTTTDTESTQDIVGTMVSTNTENGIAVTYDDSTGKLNFDVADFTITQSGDTSGSVTVTNLASATLNSTLATVNSNVGSFGSTTAIPVITVNAKGLVTGVTTAAISTVLTLAADSGSNDTVTIGTDTLTIAGGTGLTTTISNNNISVAIDSTVATLTGSQTLTNKTLTSPTLTGTISGNLTATGQLSINSGGHVIRDVSGEFILQNTNDEGFTFQDSSFNSYFNISGTTVTFPNSLTLDSVAISSIQTASESFADNDTSLMTSAAIDDRINLAVATKDNTDEITEGSSNLYFTNERVDDRVNALLQAGSNVSLTYDDTANTLTIAATQLTNEQVQDIIGGMLGGDETGGISVAYDDTNNEIDFTISNVPNSSLANSSVTINGTAVSLGGSITLGTDDIGEGSSNLYYTDARVQAVSINNIVEDTTPQLGGTLDTNGNLIQFGDSGSATDDRLQFGASQDLEIYHSGTHSYIVDSGTGNLNINATNLALNNAGGTKTYILGTDGGSVQLRHNDSTKIETTSTGATVTGTLGMTNGFATGRFAVKSTAVDNAYDFYNDGLSYFNDEVTVDADLHMTSGVFRPISINMLDGSNPGNGNIVLGGTVDGVDISARDAVLTSTTTTANAALPKAGGTMTGDLILGDNVKIEIGDLTGGDLQIYHGGTHSFIDNNTGNLYIRNFSDDKNIHLQSDDGSGGMTDYIVVHGSENIVKFQEHTRHLDNKQARFGTGSDLKIYHDGSHSYIADTGTGELRLRSDGISIQSANGNEYMAFFAGTGGQAVSLYAGNAVKFQTTSTGATVTGTLSATTFSGDLNGTINTATTATTQSASDNSTKVATTAYVDTAVTNLVDSSPSALDTLNELAAALGDDANFSTTVTNSIATKVAKAGDTMTGALTVNLSSEGTYFTGGSGGVRQLSITSGTNTSAHALHTFNIASTNGKYEFEINSTPQLTLDSSNATFGGDVIITQGALRASQSSTTNPVARFTNTGVNDYNFTFPNNSTLQLSSNVGTDLIFKLINDGAGDFNLDVGGDATFAGNITAVFNSNNSGNRLRIADTEGTSAAVRTYSTSDGTGLILNHYYAVSGSPYMRYSDFVSNMGDAAATTMRFLTKPHNGNPTVALTIDNSQNATFGGDVTISSATPELFFIDTNNNVDAKLLANNGNLGIFADTNNEHSSSTIYFNIDNDEKARLTSGGKLGIGTDASLGAKLHVKFANTDTSFSGGSGGDWGSEGIRIENTSGTTNTMAMLHFRNSDADIHIASIRKGTDDSDLGFYFEGAQKVVFENDGSATFAGTIRTIGTATTTFAGAISSGDIITTHTGGGTINIRRDDTSISDGDVVGLLNFQGDDPTDETFNTSVAIKAVADGTWQSGKYPGELLFQTRADSASSSLTTALTLGSDQSATFGGTVTATGGSSNNNDDANILTLNASEHARLLVDTSSTSGHRATLVLESNSNELTLATTGSASELTSVGNLTVTSSLTTFTGNALIEGTLSVYGNSTIGDNFGDAHTINGKVTQITNDAEGYSLSRRNGGTQLLISANGDSQVTFGTDDASGNNTDNWSIGKDNTDNSFKISSGGTLGTGDKFTLTTSAATFTGNVTIEKSTPTLTFNNLAGGGLDPILEASGSVFNIKTTSVTPFSINLSTQAATFAGEGAFNGGIVNVNGTTTSALAINASTHNTNVANVATLSFSYGHSGGAGVGHIKLTEDANNSFGADMTFGVPHNNGSGGSTTRTALTLDGGTLAATFVGSVSSGSTITAASTIHRGNMTIDSQEIDIGSGDFLLDVAGDITLDAAGNDIRFFKNTVEYGKFKSDNSNFAIYSSVQNKDIIFRGNDGGSTIDALTLDMSEGGNATFAGDVKLSTSGKKIIADFSSGGTTRKTELELYNPSDGGFTLNNEHASTGGIKFQIDGVDALSIAKSGRHATFGGSVGVGVAGGSNAKLEVVSTTGEVFRADAASGAFRIVANQTGVSTQGAFSHTGNATITGNLQVTGSSGDTLTLTKSTTEPSLRIEGDTDKDFVITVSGELLTFTQNDGATDILTLDHDTKNATFAGDISLTQANTPTIELKDTTNNQFLLIRHNNSASIFDVHSNSHYEFQINSSEKMRLDNSGRLGIGVTAPSYKLEVLGDNQEVARFKASNVSTALNNGGALISVQNTDSTNGNMSSLVFRTSDGTGSSAIFGYHADHSDGEGFLTFGTRNSSGSFAEKMRISSDGNVGIGTGATVRGKGLEIFRAAGSSSHPQLIISTGESSSKDYGISTDVIAAGDFCIVDGVTNVAANARLRIDSSGNIQARRARSNTAGEVALSIQPSDSTIHYGFRVDSSANTLNLDRVDAAGTLMAVSADGKVGIGTNSPEGKLMVQTTGADATPPIKINRQRDGGRIQMQYNSNENGYGEIGQMYAGAGQTVIWIGANLNSFATGHSSAAVQDDSNHESWFSTWDSYNDRFTVSRINTSGTTSNPLIINTSGATFASAVSIDGKLTLDANSLTNGIINTPASLRINIDSDNNNTGEKFVVGNNQDSINSNNELFVVEENGNATFAGPIAVNATSFDAGNSNGNGADEFLAEFKGGTNNVFKQRYLKLTQTFTGSAKPSPLMVFEANHDSDNHKSYVTLGSSSDGEFYIRQGEDKAAVAAGSDLAAQTSETFRITPAGNVGIATNSPAARLEVHKNGGNGSGGLSDYNIAGVSVGAQATIGAINTGDAYANLNLFTTVGGSNIGYHISKRPSNSSDLGGANGLSIFYFDGSGFSNIIGFSATGGATFAGGLTIGSHLLPSAGNSYDIGAAGTMFNNGYFLNVTAFTSLSAGSGSFTGDVTLAGTKSLITNSILTASGDLDIKTVLTSRDIRMYDGNNKVAVRVKGDGTGTNFRNADTRFISLNYEDSVNSIISHSGTSFGLESLNVRGDNIYFYTDYDASSPKGNLTLTLDSSHNATFVGDITLGDGSSDHRTLTLQTNAEKNSIINFKESTATYGFSIGYYGVANDFIIKRHDNSASGTDVLTLFRENSNAVFAGTLDVNGTSASTFYALQLARSGSGTTAPDIFGENNTFVIGTSSSTEVISLSNSDATFAGSISMNQSATQVDMTGNTSGNFTIDNNTGNIAFQANGSTVNSMTITSSLITLNETVKVGTGTVAAANAAADDFVITGPGTTATGMTISNTSDSGTGTIFFGDTTSSSAAGFRYNHNTGDMAISAEDNVTFACDNVGIGTTDPADKLTVSGGSINLQVPAGSLKFNEGTTNAFAIESNGANGYLKIRDTYNSADRIYIKNDGSVGIGTSAPSARFQVQQDQTAESNVIFMNNSTGSNAAMRLSLNVGNPAGNDPKISFNIGDGGFDWTMGVDNSDSDKFKISGGTDSHNPNLGTNDRLTIDASGATFTGTVSAYGNSDTTPALEIYSDSDHGMRILHRASDGDFGFERRLNGNNSEFLRVSRADGDALFRSELTGTGFVRSLDTYQITMDSNHAAGPTIEFGSTNDYDLYGNICQQGGEYRFTSQGRDFSWYNGSVRIMELDVNQAEPTLAIGNTPSDNANGVTADNTKATLQVFGSNNTDGTVRLGPHGTKGSNFSHIHYGSNGDWYIRPASNSGSVNILNYVAESDARLKENIVDNEYGLSEISQLKSRNFNWISSPTDKQQTGFIAQEVEEIVPKWVTKSEGEYNHKAVDYQAITSTLVKAVQELKAQNEDLLNRIKELENK